MRIPTWLRVPLGAVLFATNTVVHVLPLLLIALLKALVPVRGVRRVCDTLLMAIAENWIAINTAMISKMSRTRFIAEVPPDLKPQGQYLVLSNHQSWVDIPVLQAVFNKRIPLLRFFLKSQLFWVPFLGVAWWALDFPFMKRYSRETLARRPELAGRDVEATRRACEKFRFIPVSVMSFAEGTRYTAAKHAAQVSPFRYLLRPRAGGIAFVLGTLGNALQSVLDVTLVYPGGKPTFLDLLADRVAEVRVHVRERAIPREFVGVDYRNDVALRERVQAWVNDVWAEKDGRVKRMLGEA